MSPDESNALLAGLRHPQDRRRVLLCLANDANLRGADAGWLVFGVNNKTWKVVGTDYRPDPERLCLQEGTGSRLWSPCRDGAGDHPTRRNGVGQPATQLG